MTEDAVIDFVPEIVKVSEVVRKKLLRRLISAFTFFMADRTQASTGFPPSSLRAFPGNLVEDNLHCTITVLFVFIILTPVLNQAL